jgi:hypothetical protein
MNPVTIEHLDSLRDVRWVLVDPPKVPGLIEMVAWYQIGMTLGRDAEYFLFVDDDHHFVPGSGFYYQQCINYMDHWHDVGFMTTHRNHGGLPLEKGDYIVNSANGLVSLGRGMFMRNAPDFYLTAREIAYPGGMVESLLCYRMMALGYTFVKRLGCPTMKDPSKQVGIDNPTYSHDVLNRNLVGWIRQIYADPTWEHNSRLYPAGLMEQHAIAYTNRWD